MGTPKKIVADSQCFLCSDSPHTKERVTIFGKSSVDIVGLLKSIGIEASTYVNSSNLFICTKMCYKRLLKLQRLQNDLNSAKQIVIESFSKTRTKRLLSNTNEIDSRDGCCSKSNESTVSQPSKAVKSLCFASVSYLLLVLIVQEHLHIMHMETRMFQKAAELRLFLFQINRFLP